MMAASPSGDRDRLHELLADSSLFGLEQDGAIELEMLQQRFPEEDSAAFERVVASLDLASLADRQAAPPPDRLRQRLVMEAVAFQRESGNPLGSEARRFWSSEFRERLAWLTAAAAILVSVWFARHGGGPEATSALTARAKLLSTADDVLALKWTSTSAGETRDLGGVLWSDARQEGYMTFRSLPVNNPEVEQYQLWIFDERQDPKYPIDGGVFNMPQHEGDVIIAIHPKLQVRGAAQFAITIERPGGVVVSSRQRLPLLAKR